MSVEYALPGIHVREHRIEVPLDWGAPESTTIEVFARELAAAGRQDEELPLLVFLQGGPGGRSPRPLRAEDWIGRALEDYRVVLLDQRGTGRSTPVTASRIAGLGERGADYLLRFRADSIVRDLEQLRKTVYGGRRWTTLGQSYGGFITLSYLSSAPEGLDACLVAGGLPSIEPSAGEVYRRTYPRVRRKTERYYAAYPQDVERVAAVADFVAANEVRLPDGDRLSVRRLQTLGLDLGMSRSAERMHWLFEDAWAGDSAAPEELADVFLEEVGRRTSYWGNPLFAVMHESIYGSGDAATDWTAEAVRSGFPEFSESSRPLLFTGEMMFPWMFEEIASLRPFADAAERLARHAPYGPLYDVERLASNDVPVNAVIYFDDMYVDSGIQLETLDRLGNARAWVTNEFEHDGLWRGSEVLDRLLRLRDR